MTSTRQANWPTQSEAATMVNVNEYSLWSAGVVVEGGVPEWVPAPGAARHRLTPDVTQLRVRGDHWPPVAGVRPRGQDASLAGRGGAGDASGRRDDGDEIHDGEASVTARLARGKHGGAVRGGYRASDC